MNEFDIVVLCKVVDNFGDIGVVYRLARELSSLQEDEGAKIKLTIVVDNLKSFSLLEPKIDSNLDYQEVNDWKIFRWDANDICSKYFEENTPKIILECFQCGRPDWLEELLFVKKIPNVCHIFMIDYLTAEPYAETFHKLQSLTRSAKVQKVNFMPGFTQKTGGLILDKEFINSLNSINKNTEQKQKKMSFNAVFFNYPKDLEPAVLALQEFNVTKLNETLTIKLSRGVGFDSFKNAYDKVKEQVNNNGQELLFNLEYLDFIPQTEWDRLLCSCDLLFIRGEDSLSRAALLGVPYVWHAYPQSEDYQLVKVQALLDVMKPYFSEELFKILKKCWLTYNGKPGSLQDDLREFLFKYDDMKPCFKAFSQSLLKNGDLALNLLNFIKEKLSEETA